MNMRGHYPENKKPGRYVPAPGYHCWLDAPYYPGPPVDPGTRRFFEKCKGWIHLMAGERLSPPE
jgi:hypothetical protein